MAVRLRIWMEKNKFEQTELNLSCQDIRDLLTPEQLAEHRKWAIVPNNPLLPVSKSNAVVIDNEHHRFIVNIWETSKDAVKYHHFLFKHQFVNYLQNDYKG